MSPGTESPPTRWTRRSAPSTLGRHGTGRGPTDLRPNRVGRYRLVVVTEGADGRDFIITARDMTANEKRMFRAKGR